MCLAIPGEILSIEGDAPLERVARVSFGGVVKKVRLAYVPEASVGDFVVTHVGFALSVVDAEAAARSLAELAAADLLPSAEEVVASEVSAADGADLEARS